MTITREKILAMTADELRLAVAEHIDGYHWETCQYTHYSGGTHWRKGERMLVKKDAPNPPDYPNDIAAAWSVIVALQKRGWFYTLWDVVELPEHGCRFYALDLPDAVYIDANVCIAIVRAALIAIMSESA